MARCPTVCVINVTELLTIWVITPRHLADLFTEDAVWSGVDLILDGRPAIREWFLRREGRKQPSSERAPRSPESNQPRTSERDRSPAPPASSAPPCGLLLPSRPHPS